MIDFGKPELIIKYRFSDDPIDTVREYKSTPKWDEESQAVCIIPANTFPGKSIILLGEI